MSAQNETEVESLLMSPCWSQAHAGPTDQYMLDGHKLLLEHDLDSLPSSDTEGQKSTIEVLDNLLLSSHQSLQTNLAELKPLPPFTGYTGHLSINGISGHHYHAISQRLPDDNNNNSLSNNNNLNHSSCLSHSPFSHSSNNGPSFNQSSNNNNHGSGNSCSGQQPLTPNSCSSTSSPTDHNIVSSSTCLPDSGLHPDEPCLHDVKLFSPDSDSKMYNVADSCVMANGNNSSQNNNNNNGSHTNGSGNRNMSSSDHRMADSVSGLKIYTNESKELTEYDMSSIEDIAAIIGSAIADTTVPSRMDDADTNHNNESRDSWMDLDAWIDGACVQTDGKMIISQQDSMGDYVMPQSPHSINGGCPNSGPIMPSPGSTLQNLLTHGYMPLLQNRLQNGPPNSKGETPSSTSYGGSDLISTSTSPPGSVVSTTDNIIMGNGLNGSRFVPSNVNNQHHYQLSMNIKADGLCSPDLLSNNNNNNNTSTNNNNYPHTTTILGNSPSNQQSSKMKRARVPKHKLSGSSQSPGGGGGGGRDGGGGGGGMGNGSHLGSSGPLSPSMGLGFQGNDLSGLLGKEKPVHRCNICNRGFLNKSNIKVHLRTHTGEKPFRCDVCSKAFRQKAHLIKHQQIHKRIGRD